MSVCSNKKCRRELPPAAKYKMCEVCRPKWAASSARRRARLAVGRDQSLCSVPACRNTADLPGKRICSACTTYRRQYRKVYRAREKDPSRCRMTDCPNAREDAQYALCVRCRARARTAQQSSPTYRKKHGAMRSRVRAEVMAYYGPACKCCDEWRDPFLTIDHIDGSGHKHVGATGRRVGGGKLYAWLRRQGFPTGYRVLCVNCNFALGHHGYCPHGDLTQESKRGRPALGAVNEKKRAYRRAYWIAYKMEVLGRYGDGCACCGEKRHEFLSIEHPGQTGAAHRKELNGRAGDGRNFLVWLRKNGYPPGYAVLCMSCNFATRLGAACPHETARVEQRGT